MLISEVKQADTEVSLSTRVNKELMSLYMERRFDCISLLDKEDLFFFFFELVD